MCVLERNALHVILFLAGLISFESFIRRMYIRGGDRKKILKFFLEEKLKYEKMKKMGEEIDQMTGIFHEMNNLIERRVNEFIGNLQAEMDVLNENFRTLQEEGKYSPTVGFRFQSSTREKRKRIGSHGMAI